MIHHKGRSASVRASPPERADLDKAQIQIHLEIPLQACFWINGVRTMDTRNFDGFRKFLQDAQEDTEDASPSEVFLIKVGGALKIPSCCKNRSLNPGIQRKAAARSGRWLQDLRLPGRRGNTNSISLPRPPRAAPKDSNPQWVFQFRACSSNSSISFFMRGLMFRPSEPNPLR